MSHYLYVNIVSLKKKEKDSLKWKEQEKGTQNIQRDWQLAQNNEDKRKNILARDSESTTRDCEYVKRNASVRIFYVTYFKRPSFRSEALVARCSTNTRLHAICIRVRLQQISGPGINWKV